MQSCLNAQASHQTIPTKRPTLLSSGRLARTKKLLPIPMTKPAGKLPGSWAVSGGKKGGPARAAKLTPEERQRIAREAAKVRWSQMGAKHPKITENRCP